MKSRLYTELERHIQLWMDENCEADDWMDMVTGDKTVEYAAKAAAAVVDACQESQKFAVREGFLKSA